MIDEYDVDLLQYLLSLTRENEIDFGVTIEPHWFPFKFDTSKV